MKYFYLERNNNTKNLKKIFDSLNWHERKHKPVENIEINVIIRLRNVFVLYFYFNRSHGPDTLLIIEKCESKLFWFKRFFHTQKRNTILHSYVINNARARHFHFTCTAQILYTRTYTYCLCKLKRKRERGRANEEK